MLVAKEKPKFTSYQEWGLKRGNNPWQNSYDLPLPRERRIPVPRESVLLCAMLLCLIIIGVGLITQYGNIIAGNYRIHQMRNEIALLQEENEQLLLDVKRLSSLDRIEAIAANELGLQYPEKRQWLILSAGN
ncbi:MAG: cell division protein FtsL [Dethiobacteria bacterium]